jgi:cytochrome b6-f complex iron-sulfur subunit
MDTGTILAIAIPAFVVLAVLTVLATGARRDRQAAVGGLSRETRRRDRSRLPEKAAPHVPTRRTGREMERSVAAERARREGEVAVPDAAPPPAPVAPLDEETLGVTRRQFLNRNIVSLFGLGLGAFGAASLAFLWPQAGGGFGSKIRLPDSLDDVLEYYKTERKPYYYAPGRVYVVPYPKDAVAKAEKVKEYQGSVIKGMETGVVALYQKCVHLGCRVPWCATAQWFECPCHGSQYNRVGEKKGGPAPRGLDRFGVEVAGGSVTVDTSLVIEGPPIGTNTTGQEAEGPHCVGGE